MQMPIFEEESCISNQASDDAEKDRDEKARKVDVTLIEALVPLDDGSDATPALGQVLCL